MGVNQCFLTGFRRMWIMVTPSIKVMPPIALYFIWHYLFHLDLGFRHVWKGTHSQHTISPYWLMVFVCQILLISNFCPFILLPYCWFVFEIPISLFHSSILSQFFFLRYLYILRLLIWNCPSWIWFFCFCLVFAPKNKSFSLILLILILSYVYNKIGSY